MRWNEFVLKRFVYQKAGLQRRQSIVQFHAVLWRETIEIETKTASDWTSSKRASTSETKATKSNRRDLTSPKRPSQTEATKSDRRDLTSPKRPSQTEETKSNQSDQASPKRPSQTEVINHRRAKWKVTSSISCQACAWRSSAFWTMCASAECDCSRWSATDQHLTGPDAPRPPTEAQQQTIDLLRSRWDPRPNHQLRLCPAVQAAETTHTEPTPTYTNWRWNDMPIAGLVEFRGYGILEIEEDDELWF